MYNIAKDAERKNNARELLKTQKDVRQLIIDNQYYKEQIKEIHNKKESMMNRHSLKIHVSLTNLGNFL